MHRFSLTCDARGMWTLTGATGTKPLRFRDLPAAVEFAREDACGSEADIELRAEGLYMFVHQKKGWPHCLYARAPERREGATTTNARNLMTTMEPGTRALTHQQLPANVAGRTLRATAYRYVRAGFEGLIVVGLFLVLAGAALYLRARLGFVMWPGAH
jgi:hypothetical protein